MGMKIDVKTKTENGRTSMINNLKHWHENLNLMTIQDLIQSTNWTCSWFKWNICTVYVTVKQEILHDDDDKDVKPKVEACKIKFHKEPEITKLEKPEILVVQDVLQSKQPELIFLQVCL